jgi:hypothetical protein
VAKLGAVELEQVIKLVGRSPRIYPPGTLDTLKQRKALISPPPSDSVPSNNSAKKQAWRPQHSADWLRRRHTRTPAGLGGSPSPMQAGNGAGPLQNAERIGSAKALKGFTDGFYKNLCSGKLGPVLETLEYLKHETNVWFEITTLLIPGENDSPGEIEAESAWVMDRLGPDLPMHFTAFHPDWKLMDHPPTPPQTLRTARRIATNAGLRYIYTGNVHGPAGQATHCHACGSVLIGRDWYNIAAWHLSADGCCAKCGTRCHGVFEAIAGQWGRQRQPMRLRAARPELFAH